MIHRLIATADTRLMVHGDEDAWCDIEITQLVQGVGAPVDVVIRLAGSLYPLRNAQAQFISALGAGLVTRIVDAPSQRCDWRTIHCQDLRPEYLFMDQQHEADRELGAGDHLEIDLGERLYSDLVNGLRVWPGRGYIPRKLRQDPWGRGESLTAAR